MKITVFSGGRGTEAIVKAIFSLQEERVITDLELTLLVNAYDYGRSTAEVRTLFDIPAPSDPRKNLIHLLDPESPHYGSILQFLNSHFGRDDDNDSTQERTVLEAMAGEDAATLENFRKGALFLQLPEQFRKLIGRGLRIFLARMDERGSIPDYSDFSIMNAVLAGLAGVGGCVQKALDLFQDDGVLPLRGRVVLNSLQNRYLYAVPEVAESGAPGVLDEARIVAHRSRVRIKELYLLPRPLQEAEITAWGPSVESGLAARGSGLAAANPRALECLQNADAIIYGPGTQHSSLLPTYLTAGFANTISDNHDARKILICNTGEDVDTHGYTASDIYLNAVRYISKGAGKAAIPHWTLVSDVIVNFPAPGTSGSQPHSASFVLRDDHASHWYIDSPDAVPPDTLQRIIFADVESEGSPGRHSATKLRNVFARILTGKPLWYQKVRRRLTSGAIIFDVDETILEPAGDPLIGSHKEPEIEPPVIAILIELLDAGFRLCAVTGNDFRKFRKRFVHYLEDRLRTMGRLELMEGFEAYGDGAATHVTFAVEEGAITPRQDNDYNIVNQIQASDYETLRTILKEFEMQADLIPPPEELFQTYDRGSWKYDYSVEEARWLEEGKPLLRVEERGDRVMLTLKSLPSRKHLRKGLVVEETVRRRVWRQILDRMEERMKGQAANYSCNIAGRGSIDITRRISKATAVRHYLHRHKLRECDVIYFGNELSVGGNDRPVATGIPGVHVISVNQLESEVQFERNIFYGGGRGTASARQQFGDILERLRRALSLAEKYSPAPSGLVPVIHEKIEALYKEKLEQHRELIAREPGFNEADRFHMLSRQLHDINQALRLRSGREISLIIPAAGGGERLGNGVPKPLFLVAGKPAFLSALEAFAPLAGRIAMIISPGHRKQFTSILEGRPERIVFVEQPHPDGEWDAVRLGFDALSPSSGPVIVAWADLAFATVSRIRETIDFHLSSGADMTFPTVFERNPYAGLIRDAYEQPVALVLTPHDGIPREGYSEHDCSFFVLQPDALALVLNELQARAASGQKNIRFIDAVSILREKNRRVEALAICRPGDFMGFNKLEEADSISRYINRHE